MKSYVPWLAAAFATAGAAIYFFTRDPWAFRQDGKARRVAHDIANASEVELFSIEAHSQGLPDGNRTTDARPSIAGHAILASAKLTPAEASQLANAVEQDLGDAGNLVAACFDPHHALLLKTKGGEEYVLVCFKCAQGCIASKSEHTGFTMSGTSKGVWDSLLRAHATNSSSTPPK